MKPLSKQHRPVFLSVVVLVILIVGDVSFAQQLGSVGKDLPLAAGDVDVPQARSLPWQQSSKLHEHILQYWAKQPLGDWKKEGKTRAPRALMARLLSKKDLEAANAYLLAAKPWGKVGSTWQNHPNGDYDFTLAALIPILYQFGEDDAVLYPKTRDHLLNVLLSEDGGKVQLTVPNSFGLVRETENHLLMTEGSRYLKNRWLELHGNSDPRFDNQRNGLEKWLLDFLAKLDSTGLYEFNSIPYLGYTMTALLNLEAFGSKKIKTAARKLLDRLNWDYALGSFDLRRFAPFRRQYKHADDVKLDADYHTALIKSWISLSPRAPESLVVKGGGLHHAIWGCWSPYRLPDETVEWILNKPSGYFARIGHGSNASPEIYSGGPSFLLTAGGVNRGLQSQIIARPITLLLRDGASKMADVVHLSGPGSNFNEWNNTGVWNNLAVAAGPVNVPKSWQVTTDAKGWSIYLRPRNLCIAVYSQRDLGIVYVADSSDANSVLQAITKANTDREQLSQTIVLPTGQTVAYDLNAAKNEWVIKAIDNTDVDRDFDHWPILTLEKIATNGD